MYRWILSAGCLFASVWLLQPALSAQEITLESLLREMTDLERLTRLPDPPYVTRQFSSYDQRSTDPEVLTDENWFANGDRGQHLGRREGPQGREFLLMDADGPGAIVRIWSANPDDAGDVRIYIDGAKEPAIDMPLTQFLGGEHALTQAPIGGQRSRGWNSYLPIPYAKSCVVTTTRADFYYHINYRTYPRRTKVESFSAEVGEKHAELIRQTAAVLKNPISVAQIPANWEVAETGTVTLEPSAEAEIGPFFGEAAIYEITSKVEAANIEEALRGVVAEFRFDNRTEPDVVAPIGDFYGAAPGINPYASLPCGVKEDGTMYSHWVMPYREGVSIRLRNTTGDPVTVSGAISTAPYDWTENSLYFHAKWRSEWNIATRPRQDWNYLTVEGGAGRFVGAMLHITNSVTDWWGEGDEKIYVDNEAFPSHFGTGSEDYFGYAWCNNEPFTHAYHNQPRADGPGNYGQTCNSRFHIIDDIPFTSAFRFDMEVWHWAETQVDQSAVAYWYASGTSTDNFPAIDPAYLKVPQPRPIEHQRVEGALEAEDFQVLRTSGGDTTVQTNTGWKWSNGSQLWWTGARPGDSLEVAFSAEKAGRFQVMAVFTRAIDYGTVSVAINGTPGRESFDFYNTEVRKTDEVDLGVFDLQAGANTLTIQVLGKNVAATDYMFGLDYLRLTPAR